MTPTDGRKWVFEGRLIASEDGNGGELNSALELSRRTAKCQSDKVIEHQVSRRRRASKATGAPLMSERRDHGLDGSV